MPKERILDFTLRTLRYLFLNRTKTVIPILRLSSKKGDDYE